MYLLFVNVKQIANVLMLDVFTNAPLLEVIHEIKGEERNTTLTYLSKLPFIES